MCCNQILQDMGIVLEKPVISQDLRRAVVPRKELITWPAACDAGGQQREKLPLRATEPEMSLGGDRQRGPEE